MSVPAHAGTLMTQRDALMLAFPSGRHERRTLYLTEEQRKAAETLGRVKVESRVWTYYEGAEGFAYFDTHVVRTMPETFMAALAPDGSVRFVELVSFQEPDDYLPRPRWLDQFKGRKLDRELMVRRGIRNMTGASLTSEALADGVRRVLAVHSVGQAEKVQSPSR